MAVALISVLPGSSVLSSGIVGQLRVPSWGWVMHPATFALCVPLTLPLSRLGVVMVAVAFLADIARRQSRSLSDNVDSGSKTVLFARGAGPSRRPCVLRVGLGVCPCSRHAGCFQRAVCRFCSRPFCLDLCSAAVGPFVSESGQMQP